LKVGYARTSTLDQQAGLDAQIRELTAAGVERIFSEQVSAVGKRPQLDAALDFIRQGDSLFVTRLDRLARSTRHLQEITERVKAKQADLCILNLGNTSSATGRLTFAVVGAIAIFVFTSGQLLVLRPDGVTTLRNAETEATRIVLIGGETMDGPRHIWWNFVSSRPERIEQAKADWKARRFDTVPGDAEEFIPLPDADKVASYP
jgi:hypothetical protein